MLDFSAGSPVVNEVVLEGKFYEAYLGEFTASFSYWWYKCFQG
jgi:hypothetical protein